jgi:hypothetical protein
MWGPVAECDPLQALSIYLLVTFGTQTVFLNHIFIAVIFPTEYLLFHMILIAIFDATFTGGSFPGSKAAGA